MLALFLYSCLIWGFPHNHHKVEAVDEGRPGIFGGYHTHSSMVDMEVDARMVAQGGMADDIPVDIAGNVVVVVSYERICLSPSPYQTRASGFLHASGLCLCLLGA